VPADRSFSEALLCRSQAKIKSVAKSVLERAHGPCSNISDSAKCSRRRHSRGHGTEKSKLKGGAGRGVESKSEEVGGDCWVYDEAHQCLTGSVVNST